MAHHFVFDHQLLRYFLLQMHDHFHCHHQYPHLPQMKKEHPPIFPIKQAQKYKS